MDRMEVIRKMARDHEEPGTECVDETLGLILFVHLALAADPEKQLSSTGLGRTHHRILFLVGHRPGITVGEIYSLLRVTPQSIQAPLRTLIDNALVEQQSSERDKRKRHLILTERGAQFLQMLSKDQHARIKRALAETGAGNTEHFMTTLKAMMDEADREWLYPEDAPLHALGMAGSQLTLNK